MNPATVSAIKDALTPLASRLNESADFMFKAYVTHAYTLGIGLIIGGTLCVIVGIITGIITWRKWEDLDIMQIGGPFLTAISLTIGHVLLSNGIMHMVAPEYYALHDIICVVKDCIR